MVGLDNTITVMSTARYYEYLIKDVYELLLQNGDVAIDIGANQGLHTYPMARKVKPDGKVYSFEPIPIHYHQLLDEISNNKMYASVIQMYPYALSDRDEKMEFIVNLDNTAYCSGFHKNENVSYKNTKKIIVESRKIDSIFTGLESVKFVKIDVDGAELKVLNGAKNLLRKQRPVIAFECGDFCSKSYGYRSIEIFIFLQSLDYEIYTIKGYFLATKEHFSESTTLQTIWNYIAINKNNSIVKEKVINRLTSIARAFDDIYPSENNLKEQCNIEILNKPDHIFFKNHYDYIDLDLVLFNNSSVAWVDFSFLNNEAGIVKLGMIWTKNGKYITEDRRILPCTIFPGDKINMKLHLSSNTAFDILDSGEYELFISLVKEHVFWFDSNLILKVIIS